LEAESPVSSEISGFTPYAHVQSNIQHIKYAEKTDDWRLGKCVGLGFRLRSEEEK